MYTHTILEYIQSVVDEPVQDTIEAGGDVKVLSHLRPRIEEMLRTVHPDGDNIVFPDDVDLCKQFLRSKLFELTVEICITFKEDLRDQYEGLALRRMVQPILERYVKNHKNKETHVFMVGEYSDTGHYHMHGILSRFSGEQVDKLKRVLKRHFGPIQQIKCIKYPDSYVNYMFKTYVKDMRNGCNCNTDYARDIDLDKDVIYC